MSGLEQGFIYKGEKICCISLSGEMQHESIEQEEGKAMKKYRVSSWHKRPIEAVECKHETVKYVWIVECSFEWKPYIRQARKASRNERYFDTWEDAQRWLVGRQQGIVEMARAELKKNERLLDEYRSLSEKEAE